VTQGRRVVALLFLAAALVLVFLGQFYFFHRRDYLWDGVVFHALAVVALALAWRQVTVRDRQARTSWSHLLPLRDWVSGWLAPTALMALGLGLSCAAAFLALSRAWNHSTGDAVTLWLLGIGAAAAAALYPVTFPSRLRWDLKARLRALTACDRRNSWLEIATVVGLTLLAGILRATALKSVPYVLAGDEAWFGLTARQVLSGELRNPFVTAYVSMPTLFYWPLSWAMRLVGDGVTGLRLPAAVVGTATVPLLYLLARQLWGRRTAVVSATFLATYDYHIHYSRIGANNVWDPLLVVLTLWLVELGLDSSGETIRTRYFILAGLVMGLSTFFYTGARLLPFLVVAYVAFAWVTRRAQRSPEEKPTALGSPLVMLGLAFLVAAGPMLGFALSHPDDWNARINQVGIFQSGWLAREPGLTGKSSQQILFEQFLRAAGAFHVFPDRTVWYGADRPLLGFLAGAFAVLGMAWAGIHWRERRNFLVLLWFWAVIITGGMLTESPPSSQRLVIAIPAVALLVAIGLEQTVRLAGRLLGRRGRQWENLVLGLLVAGLGLGSVYYYFVQFTPQRRYGSANGVTATMMGHYLQELEGEYQAYFFGPPRMSWAFGTMPFLAPDVLGQDIVEPLSGVPDFPEGRSAVFLFLPERAGELEQVRRALPDGQLREFVDVRGELRFIAYEVQ
jgi:4-amino-4-deoxy-L-arabinose transferase-like glycosyltransferase